MLIFVVDAIGKSWILNDTYYSNTFFEELIWESPLGYLMDLTPSSMTH